MTHALTLDPDQRPKARSFAAIARGEWARLGHWLLVWVILANIVFLPMWLIGAPPRAVPIMAAGIVGLLVRKGPAWFQFVTFMVMLTLSVMWFIAGVFNLAISSLFYSLRFMMEIQPAQSFEYIGGAVLLVGVCFGAWLAVRRDSVFTDWRLSIIAAAAVTSLALFDLWIGQGMRGHYERAAAVGAPFESAMETSGAEQNAIASKRNLAIIMVESLGVPVKNAEMQRLLFSGFDTPVIEDRFAAERGTSLYYYSTTSGEVREMCGRWGDYYEIVDAGGDDTCLPTRMKQAGYQTHSLHGFEGSFFKRETWYPGIGFETSRFSNDLREAGAELCGGVFAGACDRDIPAQLAKQLKSTDQPQLVYWLTLNSHLPVPDENNLEVELCERFSAELARNFPMICRQFYLWDQIEKALVAEIAKPDFPPTDFLIVGDHMPPYFERRHRAEFAPDRVPYLYLRWRDDFALEPASE